MSERNLDFNKVVERRGTKSLKYDFAVERGRPKDVLPLWVADMDFKISSYIEDALLEQVRHAIYGYTETDESYFEAVREWFGKHHNWDVKKEWFIHTPGVVFAIALAVRAFTEKGDSVLIQQPVYYPFSEVITDNGRKLVSNDLVYDSNNGSYSIDFEDFERKIAESRVKLFLLCSPHNPVGRVWDADELIKIGNICKKYGVIVFSDEIHADFAWEKKHHVFTTVDDTFADFSIIATAPSKTFNIAGLQVSNIFIPDSEIKKRFEKEYDASGYSQLNSAGIIAAEAAYKDGEEWYLAMREYVKANIDFADTFIRERIPGVKMIKTEGTYLVWLDFGELGLEVRELDDLIINKAGLWLDSGRIFGKTGRGFQRINVACPRKTLEEALIRIENAVNSVIGQTYN